MAQNATERYLQARKRMLEKSIPIKPHILRAYLDEQRMLRNSRTTCPVIVVVITRKATPEMMELFRNDTIDERHAIVNVQGMPHTNP